MLFSTIIGDQTKVAQVRNISYMNQKMIIVTADIASGDRKGFGLRPKTSEARNQFEDKDCDHTNFTGDIVTVDETAIRKTKDQSYGFPVLWAMDTYEPMGSWWDFTIFTFPGSPIYEFTSTWINSGYDSYQTVITVDSRIDPIRIEQRSIRRIKKLQSREYTAWIIRSTVSIDFESNLRQDGSNTVYGSESNPNPIPLDWSLIIPDPKVNLSFRRIRSSSKPEHPELELNLWARAFEEACFETGIPDELLSFGDLAQSAIDSTRALDINTPAFLLDFLKTKDILLGIWRVLSGDFSPKALSSLFLSFRYGVNLTIKDAKELAEAIKQVQRDIPDNEFSIVRRGTSGECTAYYTMLGSLEGEWYHNFKMYYDPYPDNFRSLVRSMYSWDLFPSWQNLWDYIPFSFVLDWFLKIEDELERWDTRNYVATLKFDSCILTSKKIYPLPESLLVPAGGTMLLNNAKVVLFRRRIVETPPMPISRLDSPSGPFTNWLEGSALFIQRMF